MSKDYTSKRRVEKEIELVQLKKEYEKQIREIDSEILDELHDTNEELFEQIKKEFLFKGQEESSKKADFDNEEMKNTSKLRKVG